MKRLLLALTLAALAALAALGALGATASNSPDYSCRTVAYVYYVK